MKRVSAAIIACIALTGCAHPKVIDGKTYEPYGLVNADDKKDPTIRYKIPVANLVVGMLCSETFLVPGFILGWDLYAPVAKKTVQAAQS